MRFNFYITAENDEEAQACINFIRDMTNKRQAKVDPPRDDETAISAGTPIKQRANVSPGEPSISKIGGATKDYLINELKAGSRSVEYSDFHKYVEHLKLLWKRGEIKFDGEEYYL